MGEREDLLDVLMRAYNEIKENIRQTDSRLYQQWKAGGFLVDTDIVSMYPNISEVVESLTESEEEDEEE